MLIGQHNAAAPYTINKQLFGCVFTTK